MKNYIFSFITVLFFSIFFYQCKEVDTPVIINPSQVSLFDTTYISSTAITETPKNVLLEEFSGVKCSNCPKGNQKTKLFHSTYPSRITVLTVHNDFLASPYPNNVDLRCEDADILAAAPIGPVPSKPSTYINRIKYPSFTYRVVDDIDSWENFINAEMAMSSPINMVLEKIYVDVNERKFRYRVTLSFSEAMQNLSLGFALSESEIIAEQLDGSTHIYDYEHEWVLRGFITSVLGESLSEEIVANTVIIKEFEIDLDESDYNPNGDWKINNMEVVAFIRTNNEEILQSTKVEL